MFDKINSGLDDSAAGKSSGSEDAKSAFSSEFLTLAGKQNVVEQEKETAHPVPIPPIPQFPRPEPWPDPFPKDRCAPDGIPWPKPGCPPGSEKEKGKEKDGGKDKKNHDHEDDHNKDKDRTKKKT